MNPAKNTLRIFYMLKVRLRARARIIRTVAILLRQERVIPIAMKVVWFQVELSHL